jgi:hypothetical protein
MATVDPRRRSSSKHSNQTRIPLPSFPLGLDWSNSPESIPDGALVEAENCEYKYSNSRLKTAAGVDIEYTGAGTIGTGYYDNLHSLHLFNIGTTLYSTPDFSEATEIGTLTGSNNPVYHEYNGVILIATGAKLQKWDGLTLATIADSPNLDYVTDRDGRVTGFIASSHNRYYSTRSDEEDWTNVEGDTSSAQTEPIADKSPGGIVAIDMGKDVIVYKSNGKAYREIGEVGDVNSYGVKEACADADCLHHSCALTVNNEIVFLGKGGLKSLRATSAYSDYEAFELGLNVNAWIVKNIDSNAKMFHIKSRKLLMIVTQNDKRVYLYHYMPVYSDGRGRWTVRTLKYQLSSVWETDTDVYIAYGTKIGKLNDNSDLDDDEQIQMSIIGKKYLPGRKKSLVKYRSMLARNILPGSGSLQIGKKVEALSFNTGAQKIYGNTTLIDGNTNKIAADEFTRFNKPGGGASTEIQPKIITNSGSIEICDVSFEKADL